MMTAVGPGHEKIERQTTVRDDTNMTNITASSTGSGRKNDDEHVVTERPSSKCSNSWRVTSPVCSISTDSEVGLHQIIC